MPPGWQPTVDGGDQVVAETSGNASGVGAQASAGVLVGRARELATITAAMAAARRGTARVVHLVGEPGIGKTALAEQAAALASGQGWVVAWGRAWDAAAAPPYWIWQQVLGSLVRVTDVSSRVGSVPRPWPGWPTWCPSLLGLVRCRRCRPWARTAPGSRCSARSSMSWGRPRPTGQEVLATVAGLAPGRFADAVGEAVAAGILWRRSSEHPSCGFVHVLLREAARAAVAVDVRRGLHLEVAAALEALPARHGRLAEVAHHRRAALPAGDPQVMVDRTVAAGEEALRVFAHEAAVTQCTAGLSAIGPYGSGGAVREWQAGLLCVLGEAQLHAGDPVRARQTLTDAHALATGTGDPALAAEAVARMPRLTQFLVPDRELESLLTGALEALGDAARSCGRGCWPAVR